jgi:[acyl-carrier-protein] S-malonyltransferase
MSTNANKIAWIFAGQGSQTPGMGSDIYHDFPQTAAIFKSPAAGFDLAELCFQAPAQTLADTRFTQPCMAAFAAAVVRVLHDHHVPCNISMGLSLGEYCALHAAGVLSSEQLIELLAFRGSIMAEAACGLQTQMLAVFGLDDQTVTNIVAAAAAQSGQIVSCTNYNCPGQVVIGGQSEAVQLARLMLEQRGAKRCVPLNTSGPFHTELMQAAQVKLQKRLTQTKLLPQKVPVIFNATAQMAADSQIPTLLTRQIASPVLFGQSLQTLFASGATAVIEIGPGKVLAGLIRKINPAMPVLSIQDTASLREVINRYGE